jgi:hypothetical protein
MAVGTAGATGAAGALRGMGALVVRVARLRGTAAGVGPCAACHCANHAGLSATVVIIALKLGLIAASSLPTTRPGAICAGNSG